MKYSIRLSKLDLVEEVDEVGGRKLYMGTQAAA